MGAMDRLAALVSAPKPWLITTTFADGRTRMLRQPREDMARSFANRESRKIGRDLIDRATNATVRVVRVSVDYAPE